MTKSTTLRRRRRIILPDMDPEDLCELALRFQDELIWKDRFEEIGGKLAWASVNLNTASRGGNRHPTDGGVKGVTRLQALQTVRRQLALAEELTAAVIERLEAVDRQANLPVAA